MTFSLTFVYMLWSHIKNYTLTIHSTVLNIDVHNNNRYLDLSVILRFGGEGFNKTEHVGRWNTTTKVLVILSPV